MFERLKALFQHKQTVETEEIQPPVIITIHGYGRRCKHEFDNLKLWGEKDGYEIITFDIYDLFDEYDCNPKKWVARTKQQVDVFADSNRDIYLVGFSMGGVIASYLAAVCKIKKLILLAPAFQYINLDTVTEVIMKSYASLIGNEKKDEIPMPKSFYSAFTEIIKNHKHFIEDVKCPILILHGDEDEVISYRSSINAFDKIKHNQKKLILLHGGHHRLLMDETVNWECYQIMKLFFNDQILQTAPIEQAKDIMDELLKKYQELQTKTK